MTTETNTECGRTEGGIVHGHFFQSYDPRWSVVALPSPEDDARCLCGQVTWAEAKAAPDDSPSRWKGLGNYRA